MSATNLLISTRDARDESSHNASDPLQTDQVARQEGVATDPSGTEKPADATGGRLMCVLWPFCCTYLLVNHTVSSVLTP